MKIIHFQCVYTLAGSQLVHRSKIFWDTKWKLIFNLFHSNVNVYCYLYPLCYCIILCFIFFFWRVYFHCHAFNFMRIFKKSKKKEKKDEHKQQKYFECKNGLNSLVILMNKCLCEQTNERMRIHCSSLLMVY